MPECTRTFVAIPVPEPIEQELLRLQAELAPLLPGWRMATSPPFHLTLAFLGDVPTEHVDKICQVVATCAEPFEPFAIQVTGLGAFPTPSRPRVLWAGVIGLDLKPLFDLHDSVSRALERIEHGPDDDRFAPHVTLGRIRNERRRAGDLTDLIERRRLWSAGTFVVDLAAVFASTRGPSGPIYEVLGHGRFSGKKTEGAP